MTLVKTTLSKTTLIPVVFKKSRLTHTYKCHGGLLNSQAVHGKGYYVRRVTGKDLRSTMGTLKDIAKTLA